MDWDEDSGPVPSERPAARDTWREARSEGRPSRKGLEDRLEGWVSRGRELVDGVSGTRPGTRASGRGMDRPGMGGRNGLEGLGRWVEGRLDWLLDDRDDWREPWQEEGRPPVSRWDASPPQSRSTRPPLEAISRRGAPRRSPDQVMGPPRGQSPGIPPSGGAPPEGVPAAAPAQDWPADDAFSVSRWRREEPAPQRPVNPLADPPPAAPPGRPLPRSTRRR